MDYLKADTLESGVDVGQGKIVGPGKFGKKNNIGPGKKSKLINVGPTMYCIEYNV